MTDLNPAEQAAAEALWEHWTPIDGDPDLTIESFYDEARTVVAAVRGPLYREAADVLDKLAGSAPLHTLDGLVYAADKLAEMPAAALLDLDATST